MISTHVQLNINKSRHDSVFFHLNILRKCAINVSDLALSEAMLSCVIKLP